MQAVEADLKRKIYLLASEKGLKDLYHMTNVGLVGISCLEGFQREHTDLMCARDSAIL